jgi:hypothetical protein
MKHTILALCALALASSSTLSAPKRTTQPKPDTPSMIASAETLQLPTTRTGPVTFAWDANPANQNVTEYRLSEGTTPLGTTAETSLRIEAGFTVGVHTVALTAANAAGESDPTTLTFQVIDKPTAPASLHITSTQ